MDHGGGAQGAARRPLAGPPAAAVPGAAGEPELLQAPHPEGEARAAARAEQRDGRPLPQRRRAVHEPCAHLEVGPARGGCGGLRGGRQPGLGRDGAAAAPGPPGQGDGEGGVAAGGRVLPQPVHGLPPPLQLHVRRGRQHTGRAARHAGDKRPRGGHLVRPVVRHLGVRDRVPRRPLPPRWGLPRRHADRRVRRAQGDVPTGALGERRVHPVQPDTAKPLQPEHTHAVLQPQQGPELRFHRAQGHQGGGPGDPVLRGPVLRHRLLYWEARLGGYKAQSSARFLLQETAIAPYI
eukprot:666943-Hanusia_phi.AAC.8